MLAWGGLLAGCRSALRANLLPESLGAWRRTALVPAASPEPGPIPRGSIRRAQTARYESQGAGAVDVVLFELSSSADALDAVQRWTPSADTVFFYRAEYFVVVRHAGADRKAVNLLVRDLNQNLTPEK